MTDPAVVALVAAVLIDAAAQTDGETRAGMLEVAAQVLRGWGAEDPHPDRDQDPPGP